MSGFEFNPFDLSDDLDWMDITGGNIRDQDIVHNIEGTVLDDAISSMKTSILNNRSLSRGHIPSGLNKNIDEDDDDDDSEDGVDEESTLDQQSTSSMSGASISGKKKAATVREHSKNQREKRKAILQDYEKRMKALFDEFESSDSRSAEKYESMNLMKLDFVECLNTFLWLFFGPTGHLSENESKWQSIVDKNILVYFPSPLCTLPAPLFAQDGLPLTFGLDQLLCLVNRIAMVNASVARISSNISEILVFSATIATETQSLASVMNGNVMVSKFTLSSKNAVICGGNSEILVTGMLYSKFSDAHKLKSVQIYYDSSSLLKQYMASFGNSCLNRSMRFFIDNQSVVDSNVEAMVEHSSPNLDSRTPDSDSSRSHDKKCSITDSDKASEYFPDYCSADMMKFTSSRGYPLDVKRFGSTNLSYLKSPFLSPQMESHEADTLNPLVSSVNSMGQADESLAESDMDSSPISSPNCSSTGMESSARLVTTLGSNLRILSQNSEAESLLGDVKGRIVTASNFSAERENIRTSLLRWRPQFRDMIAVIDDSGSSEVIEFGTSDTDMKSFFVRMIPFASDDQKGIRSMKNEDLPSISTLKSVTREGAEEANITAIDSLKNMSSLSSLTTIETTSSSRSSEIESKWSAISDETGMVSVSNSTAIGTETSSSLLANANRRKGKTEEGKKLSTSDATAEDEESALRGAMKSASIGCPQPNRVLWVISHCKASKRPFVVSIIRNFVERVVKDFERILQKDCSQGQSILGCAHTSTSPDHSPKNSFLESDSELNNNSPNLLLIAAAAARLSTAAAAVSSSIPTSSAPSSSLVQADSPSLPKPSDCVYPHVTSIVSRARRDLLHDREDDNSQIPFIKRFLRWISSAERHCRQAEMTRDKELGISMVGESGKGTMGKIDEGLGVSGLIPHPSSSTRKSRSAIICSEAQRLGGLTQDLAVFFTQLRESGLIFKLISILQLAVTPEEQKPAEQFIWLCWSKHSNPMIQEYMDASKNYISEKRFDEALFVLSEAIRIDPNYAEAFNKRATVQFGLRRPQECFADIDRVVKIEPYHYGALCGKGLMLMKLRAFSEAIPVFERAMTINPLLASGSLGDSLKLCKQAVRLSRSRSDYMTGASSSQAAMMNPSMIQHGYSIPTQMAMGYSSGAGMMAFNSSEYISGAQSVDSFDMAPPQRLPMSRQYTRPSTKTAQASMAAGMDQTRSFPGKTAAVDPDSMMIPMNARSVPSDMNVDNVGSLNQYLVQDLHSGMGGARMPLQLPQFYAYPSQMANPLVNGGIYQSYPSHYGQDIQQLQYNPAQLQHVHFHPQPQFFQQPHQMQQQGRMYQSQPTSTKLPQSSSGPPRKSKKHRSATVSSDRSSKTL